MNAKRAPVKRKYKSAPTKRVGGWNPVVIAAVITGMLGSAGTITASFIANDLKAEAETVVSCPAELDKALEVRRENPTVDITYTGELEEQCQLNSAVQQVSPPAPAPLPAP